MQQKNKSRWTGLGHKRKMEIKQEERLARLPTPPGSNYYARSDLIPVIFSSRRGKVRLNFKPVYGKGSRYRAILAGMENAND